MSVNTVAKHQSSKFLCSTVNTQRKLAMKGIHEKLVVIAVIQARNQLGTPGGRRVFLEGPNSLIQLSNTFFQVGGKFFHGNAPACYGPAFNTVSRLKCWLDIYCVIHHYVC